MTYLFISAWQFELFIINDNYAHYFIHDKKTGFKCYPSSLMGQRGWHSSFPVNRHLPPQGSSVSQLQFPSHLHLQIFWYKPNWNTTSLEYRLGMKIAYICVMYIQFLYRHSAGRPFSNSITFYFRILDWSIIFFKEKVHIFSFLWTIYLLLYCLDD